jgi:hypothetical protein
MEGWCNRRWISTPTSKRSCPTRWCSSAVLSCPGGVLADSIMDDGYQDTIAGLSRPRGLGTNR